MRRWQLKAMDHIDTAALVQAGKRRLIERFQRVARDVPAYAAILNAHGVSADRIRTPEDFTRLCPVLEKQDIFGAYPIDQLCVGGHLRSLAGVLTSSGQGGRFAFGLSTRRQARHAAKAIELALELSFGTDRFSTLLINALPMGVRFSCSTVTIAETSVREDMVCALVEQFAPHHQQTILVTDPLFCKRLLDQARECGLDWGRFKVHVVLGEETFGEAFRDYVMRGLRQDPDGWTSGLAISSMGVGELGLNLFFETRETVCLRQLAQRQPEALRPAIGDWRGRVPPLLFVYDPLRIFVEVIEPDLSGFGALTISTLDPASLLPLVRYRTGDRARLLDTATVARTLNDIGERHLNLPKLPMIAVAGRDSDRLPDGRPLLDIKDAIYSRHDIADRLSGAFRIEHEATGCCIHMQMGAGAGNGGTELADAIDACLPKPTSGAHDRIQVWGHAEFPFGRVLDYERKFNYLDAVGKP
jgi:phenylacetate-CoA ligase